MDAAAGVSGGGVFDRVLDHRGFFMVRHQSGVRPRPVQRGFHTMAQALAGVRAAGLLDVLGNRRRIACVFMQHGPNQPAAGGGRASTLTRASTPTR